MRRNISRRLYLHAHLISFIHPLDNKRLTLTAPVPVEFSSFMKETEAT
jgi:23S rRNA-/tRNA-specific pseudouridylate synthase